MKSIGLKFLLALTILGASLYAEDKVVDGVVYTEKVVDGKIIWVKKMVPKKTYVTVEKIIMVPAPIESHMIIVKNSFVNELGQIVTSNRAQIRRVIRRVDRREDRRDD